MLLMILSNLQDHSDVLLQILIVKKNDMYRPTGLWLTRFKRTTNQST